MEDLSFVNVNPLDEAVNEKRYTQPNIDTGGIDLNVPIDEPTFAPPPFLKSEPKSTGSSTGSKQQQQPKRDPVNPEMKNLSKKDTKAAAAAAADAVINGYEWLHGLGNNMLKISEKKLNKLQADGEINLQVMIEYDYGHKITAGEFIKEYNEQVSGLLTVSEEFKEEIKPLLVEEFEDRGVGLTRMQRIGFIVLKDLAAKGFMFVQQMQQTRHMVEVIKEATISQYAPQQSTPPPSTPMPQQSTPSPAPPMPEYNFEPEEFTSFEPIKVIEPIEPEEKQQPIKKRGRPRKYEI